MDSSFIKMLAGYRLFREKYAVGDNSIMQELANQGQQPKIMVISCCDSRVDPALIMQCHPGDLFVVRNVANIVPPYEIDEAHHGTSAALEFGICFLKIKHLIILGHSQCGGINMLLTEQREKTDFINNWVSLLHIKKDTDIKADDYAKSALQLSLKNCLTFPWINKKILQKKLIIHLWFFDVKKGEIFTFSDKHKQYEPLI